MKKNVILLGTLFVLCTLFLITGCSNESEELYANEETHRTDGSENERSTKALIQWDILVRLIVDVANCEKHQVVPDASLVQDLGMDEWDIIELKLAIEDEFSMNIPDEDFEKWSFVINVYDYISNYR